MYTKPGILSELKTYTVPSLTREPFHSGGAVQEIADEGNVIRVGFSFASYLYISSSPSENCVRPIKKISSEHNFNSFTLSPICEHST